MKLHAYDAVQQQLKSFLLYRAPQALAPLHGLQNSVGKTIWGVIGFFSMILIALKPVFPFADQRTKKERLLISYRILEHDLDCVRIGIRERGEYDDQAKREFRSALIRKAELVLHNEGSCPKKIRQKCQGEVLNELPDSDFYIPN